jgi:hypothetical protein
MQRPASIKVKSVATAHKIVPTVKKTRDATSSCCRPNTALIEAMTGWNTADTSKYDEPVQKASADVPWSSLAMSCEYSVSIVALQCLQHTDRKHGD